MQSDNFHRKLSTIIIGLFFVAPIANAQACDDMQSAEAIASAFSKVSHLNCQVLSVNSSEKWARVSCEKSQTYQISYKQSELFALVFSQTKRNVIHQCYHTGKLNLSTCSAEFSERVCDSVVID